MQNGTFELYSLRKSERDALLRVLPLVTKLHPEYRDQAIHNAECVVSASKKLSSGERFYTADEVRVMAVSVMAARVICRGEYNPAFADLGFFDRLSIKKNREIYDELLPLFNDCMRRIGLL